MDRKWIEIMPTVLKELNKIRKNKNLDKQEYPFFNPTFDTKFDIGDMVYEKLDYPENAFGNKQPTSKFREGDYRFSTVAKKISKIIYMLDEPYYRYILKCLENVSFSENQLMKSNSIIEKYKVKSIIENRINKNKKEYLIWWKGLKKNESSWEPKENLIKDGLKNEIDDYDKLNG